MFDPWDLPGGDKHGSRVSLNLVSQQSLMCFRAQITKQIEVVGEGEDVMALLVTLTTHPDHTPYQEYYNYCRGGRCGPAVVTTNQSAIVLRVRSSS